MFLGTVVSLLLFFRSRFFLLDLVAIAIPVANVVIADKLEMNYHQCLTTQVVSDASSPTLAENRHNA